MKLILEKLKANKLKVCLLFFAGVSIIFFGFALWWGQEPEIFEIEVSSAKDISNINYVLNINSPKLLTAKTNGITNSKKNGLDDPPYGFTYANTLADLLNEIVNKPGGYFLDDIFPTEIILDNISHWEFGALIAIDDGYVALKQHYAKDQLELSEEKIYIRVDGYKKRQCQYCGYSWRHDFAELSFKERGRILSDYAQGLKSSIEERGKRQFDNSYANLANTMDVVVSRLNETTERLMANSERYLSESERPPTGRYFPEHHWEHKKATWYSMDNNFYRVRGFSWALLPILKAIEIDFKDVLDQRSVYLINRVMYALESALLINTGLWVSHQDSLAMASHIHEAKDSAINLRDLLEAKAKLSESKDE